MIFDLVYRQEQGSIPESFRDLDQAGIWKNVNRDGFYSVLITTENYFHDKVEFQVFKGRIHSIDGPFHEIGYGYA